MREAAWRLETDVDDCIIEMGAAWDAFRAMMASKAAVSSRMVFRGAI